jgi:hypothetical protein
MGVVVPGVLRQDAAEMLLTEDQHVVQALAAKRPHEPLRERVGPRRQLHPFQMIDTVGCG